MITIRLFSSHFSRECAKELAAYGKFHGKKQQKQPKLASSRTTCGKFHGKKQQKQPKLASSRATYGKFHGKKQQKQPKLASSRTTYGKFHGKKQQIQLKLLLYGEQFREFFEAADAQVGFCYFSEAVGGVDEAKTCFTGGVEVACRVSDIEGVFFADAVPIH